ncbi:hypothetical protein O6H91_02G105300 [Diphasiastrum complanatum]|uniref:Uncharacterized protein n=2 Tax=Diphasiastrum complanatum TaxID=34168 RepID=A0ACC2EJ43_DIPCM|nr:hypothetical protein O6H91_17G005800 [Diphasiastrum complanatum]KAJ7566484.1 hypothetical protein O6H91_02G105300 [Diphasiastrum complanatum]
MQLLTAILMVFFFAGCVQGEAESAKKVVQLHWYMHDTPLNGPNASSIPVTGYNASDFQNEAAHFLRGQIYLFDDPLTVGPSLTSASFGRSQGTYSFVSREEIVDYVSYTISIRTGKYNGSTLNILGASPNSRKIKEYSIVGGTGHFILSRGILREEVVNLFGPFNASATLSERATIYIG